MEMWSRCVCAPWRGALAALLVLGACGLSAPRTDTAPGVPSTRPTNTTCIAPPRPASRVSMVRAYPSLRFDQPVALAASPDHAWWFVAERGGRIWRIPAAEENAKAAELVLDMSSEVNASTGAIGVLAIALHPKFATNGKLYVSYTAFRGAGILSRVSRFVSRDGGRSFRRASEQRLLEMDQIADYHVNADMKFGPDGYLYIGFGDGGPQNDPLGRAQDRSSLKGKILRIDVDSSSATRPYGIPADNPYANGGGAPEVWARGLRNPWRFAFDRTTGDLWAGDVGNDRIEEIDHIVAGGNYGWSVREGTRCNLPAACKNFEAIDPVVELAHPLVSSITFGVAYRGAAIPELDGHLIYGDYSSGVIWEVDPNEKPPKPHMIDDSHPASAFAEDANGEPWLVDYSGTLWKIAPGHPGPSDVPALLSQTGCFGLGGKPVEALIPYDVKVPFYSDGADKRRWFAIPDGTSIQVRPDGHFDFPRGSVVAKEFSDKGVKLETRLLVRHDDGNWAGYTYQWDPVQNDARLVSAQAAGVTARLPRTWYLPHRGECARCHQAAGGYVIGLEVPQLDHKIKARTGTYDQLAAFEHAGLLGPRSAAFPVLDTGSVEQRARAWLHANCAYCHQPEATGQGDMDLRFTTPLEQMNICDVPPQFGSFDTVDARRIAPGDPKRSMLLRRIRSRSFIRMPPVGPLTPDKEGAALVEAWIKQLKCTPSK